MDTASSPSRRLPSGLYRQSSAATPPTKVSRRRDPSQQTSPIPSTPTPHTGPSTQSTEGWSVDDMPSEEGGNHLLSHIYQKGLQQSVCSDIAVHVPTFNKTYHLHRLILTQSTFFSKLLQPPWLEAGNSTVTVHFDDPNITRSAFESVLAHLYGKEVLIITHTPAGDLYARALLATAHYLDMPVLVKVALEHITNHVCLRTALKFLDFATGAHWYGDASITIRNAVLVVLARDGYDMLIRQKSPLAVHVWAHMELEWIRKVVSSDVFYVANETQRYKFIKRLLRLKRSAIKRSDIEAEEDIEHFFTNLFSHAVTYTHMSFGDLKRLRLDIDPETGKSYTPDEVLRDALWLQTTMRETVEEKSESMELALGFTISQEECEKYRDPIYPSPSSDYTMLGDAMSYLIHSGTESSDDSQHEKIQQGQIQRRSKEHIQRIYATMPPFRFGVEFDFVDYMQTDHRYYSNDFFYAGSLWNIYVQRIKSKRRTQLGVYLHRQSIVDRRHPKEDECAEHHSPPNPTDVQIPYEDKRKETHVWFRFICHPSPLESCGHSKIERSKAAGSENSPAHIGCNHFSQEPSVFESAPDKFAVSQSWGWRSGSLYPFSSKPVVLKIRRTSTDPEDSVSDLLENMSLSQDAAASSRSEETETDVSSAEDTVDTNTDPDSPAHDGAEVSAGDDDLFGGVYEIGRDKNDHGTLRICVILGVV